MATYTVSVSDDFAFGIEAAREQYNLDNAGDPDFVPLTEDRDYIAFVVNRAAASWHAQYSVPPSPAMVDRLEAENATLREQLAAKNAAAVDA
jgi:hypothetical protein